MIEPAQRVESGDGEHAVVMLHGWPDTLRLWEGQVEALAPRYRCVRLTWPGFSGPRLTRVPTLDELMAMLEPVVREAGRGRPVTLLLHDWGCVFGYEFAMRHPSLVHRVVGADIGDAGSRAHIAELSLPAKLGMVGYQSWLAWAGRVGGSVGDAMTRRFAAASRVPADPATLHAGMNWPYQLQKSGGLRGLHPVNLPCPHLFLYGRRKPFMFHSSKWLQALQQRPGSTAEAFDAGHWLMLSRREAFNAAMLRWLAQTDPTT